MFNKVIRVIFVILWVLSLSSVIYFGFTLSFRLNDIHNYTRKMYKDIDSIKTYVDNINGTVANNLPHLEYIAATFQTSEMSFIYHNGSKTTKMKTTPNKKDNLSIVGMTNEKNK
jgi:hypothetical protein